MKFSLRYLSNVSTLAVVLVLGLQLSLHAQAGGTHTVQKGETLFSIAQQYQVSVADLREWNNLSGNEIEEGQVLVIRETVAAGDSLIHTIQEQETLFSISKQYGVSIAELRTWNNLQENTLEIGQKLVIYPTRGSADTTGTGGSLVVDTQTQNNTYYIVKSGDTLYRIAGDHNMSVEELKKLNDLTSNTISVGQRLTVRQTTAPPSVEETTINSSPQGKFVLYRIQNTITLNELLEKFNMEKPEFRALNPELTETRFQPGERVTILAPPTSTYENPYRTKARLTDLGETPVSKYSTSETGNTTTSGELYNPQDLTAAHSNISVGTVMYIENPENGRGGFVRINDRISGNGLKLSEAAWQALEFSGSSPTVKIYQDR